MDVTILGSGSPIPDPTRAGTAVAVDCGTETALVDCGPGTVERMLETEIEPQSIEHLLFTHQHMDHNASFFHFVISSWLLGRRDLELYGPAETETLLEAMYRLYETDFEYRESLGRSLDGLNDIETNEVGPDFSTHIGDCRITAFPVDHSIETYGYRFDDKNTGESFVFSGDTTVVDGLADFASGANVLVHDCCVGPLVDTPPSDKPVWDKFFDPDGQYLDRLGEVHSNPAECGEVATAANVDTLVLTHLTPYLDTEQMRREAKQTFDGTVLLAEDGLTLQSPL